MSVVCKHVWLAEAIFGLGEFGNVGELVECHHSEEFDIHL